MLLVSLRYPTEVEKLKMTEEQARSIRFPRALWTAIDEDAQRCRRSAVKQMEAIFMAYYGLEDVGLNSETLELIGQMAPGGKAKTAVIDISGKKTKKRKRA
jgi:hypothetical protein